MTVGQVLKGHVKTHSSLTFNHTNLCLGPAGTVVVITTLIINFSSLYVGFLFFSTEVLIKSVFHLCTFHHVVYGPLQIQESYQR